MTRLTYMLGATHGGAIINAEIRTNPLQPSIAKLVLNSDVPLAVMTLMELQQALLGEYQCGEHPPAEPAPDCEVCGIRVTIALTAPRGTTGGGVG